MYESAFIPVQYYTKSLFLRLVLFNQLINDNVWPIAVALGFAQTEKKYSYSFHNLEVAFVISLQRLKHGLSVAGWITDGPSQPVVRTSSCFLLDIFYIRPVHLSLIRTIIQS